MDQTVTRDTPVLTGTAIRGQFLGLLGEVRLIQTFVNQEAVDIEAVFTFPVPLEAVLLGVRVRLDGRELEGQVLPKAQAEEDYEDAIADGDRAILLQSAGPGRYTVNVGHLQPGQCAELDYRYALLGSWDEDCLRLLLPTTLAPRYGDPFQAALAPHQVPGVSLAADHRFSLELDLGGVLVSARVESPSHAIQTRGDGELQRVTLAEETAAMDRDLVLLIHADAAARTATALVAPDGDGAVAWLSLQPALPEPVEPAPRDLVLLVDCSGSMAGVSIEQTRQALQTIIERLLPSDRVNLIAFGSSPDALFPGLQPANRKTLQALHRRLSRLDADLGGTELGQALRLAFRQAKIAGEGQPLDILLITDGEVWGAESLIEAARHAGHRLFTVGVGASVAEDLVRGLAQATSGACLLVHPNEDMAERIVRHFVRLRAPRASVALEWPQEPTWNWPDRSAGLFAGDTLHRLAGFASLPEGEVTLTVAHEDGSRQTQRLRLERAPVFLPADVLPRLAAARRLETLPDAEAEALALAHQLVSAHTHFILRDVAEVKAQGLPELRQVPQMLAAGWGGVGDVAMSPALVDADVCESPQPAFPHRGKPAPILSEPSRGAGIRFGIDLSNAGSASLNMDSDAEPTAPDVTRQRIAAITQRAMKHLSSSHQSPKDRAARLRAFIDDDELDIELSRIAVQSLRDWLVAQQQRLADTQQSPPGLQELADAGAPDTLIADLHALVNTGADEDALVATFLHLFLKHHPDLPIIREARRRLRHLSQRALPADLIAQIDSRIAAWCAPEVT